MILYHLNEIILTSLRLPPYANNQNMQQLPIVLPFYKRVARGFVWYLNFTERGGVICDFMNQQERWGILSCCDSFKISLKPHSQEERFEVFPFKILAHKMLCKGEVMNEFFLSLCHTKSGPHPPPHLYNPLTTLSHQHRVGLVQQQ